MYINIGEYISEIGGVSPTRKSFRSARACDAKLHVPAGRWCFRGWAAEAQEMLRRGFARRASLVPFACLLVSCAKSCYFELSSLDHVN